MGIREPKCVMWKRMGAVQVMQQVAGLTPAEEIAFWQIRTEQLKKEQEKIRLSRRA